MARLPTDFHLPDFTPRWPWLGGDLQTIRNTLVGRPPNLPTAERQRREIDLGDGTGDRLTALIETPKRLSSPVSILLIHGLAGAEDSLYMAVTAARFLALGHRVVRLNLRGAGPGRGLACHDYHSGKTEDLCAALTALKLGPVMPIGFSLGGNALLKLLGEQGPSIGARLGVIAAASVSAPIDLSLTAARIAAPRNALYAGWILRAMKRGSLAAPHLPPARRAAIRQARSCYDFDDLYVGPFNGWSGADEYYAVNSARQFLASIRVPTLLVHAADDPWIPVAAYDGLERLENPFLVAALAAGGGHLGFHARGGHPDRPWYLESIIRFIALMADPPQEWEAALAAGRQALVPQALV